MNSSRRKEELDVVRLCHITSSNMSIMEFEGLGTEYYQDDSDKECDIPIDPVWEAQQMNTFTAWCNAHLRKANMKIEAFEQDFRSGLKLMKLLEIISSDVLPPPDKGRMRFHKIANVNKALKFIEEKGVRLASIGAEEIVDGNVKMTLGMIWTIILRFTIQDILVEDSSAKEGLLLWCKRKTHGYKNVHVENFKTSFQNGLAFCALIHSHDPSLIDYDRLSPKDVKHNLDLAFTVADKNLDVPQMLSVDDMINNDHSDERSIMAYVSTYYHAFNRRDKMKSAIDNINGFITSWIEEDSCAQNYEQFSSEILQWIERMIREFEDREDVNEHSQIVSKVKLFEEYKFVDKPHHTSCQLKLQFAAIRNHVLNEKDNLIKSKWSKMEKLEHIYEKHLSDQRQRDDDIQNLLSKFEINFQVLRAWINNKIESLHSKDFEASNLCELRTLSRLQQTFIANVGSQQSRTEKLVSITDELRRLRYKDMRTIDEKVDIIVTPWDSLGSLNERRIQAINTYLNALIQVDDLQLDFAKRVTPLYNWIQQANQDLNEKFILHFIDEIKDLITAQKRFKRTVDEAHDELNQMKTLNDLICRTVKGAGIKRIPPNPYTEITITDAHKAWTQLEISIPERDKFLRDSLTHQTDILDFHSEYRKKIEKLSSALSDIQRNLFEKHTYKSSFEKKVDILQNLQDKLRNMDAAFRELELVYQKLDDYSKIDDSKTALSFEQIVSIRDTLELLITEELRSTSNGQIDSRISTERPRNRIQDYEACFRHFDRNNLGLLDAMQFRACLVSLGFSLDENEKNDNSFEQLMSEADPDNTGLVSISSYLDLVCRRNNHTSSSKQLLDSFKTISNDQDWVSGDLIRQELPPPVANYCLKNMRPYISYNGDSENRLDYKDFVSRFYEDEHGQQCTGTT